jgi:hypothetical protein
MADSNNSKGTINSSEFAKNAAVLLSKTFPDLRAHFPTVKNNPATVYAPVKTSSRYDAAANSAFQRVLANSTQPAQRIAGNCAIVSAVARPLAQFSSIAAVHPTGEELLDLSCGENYLENAQNYCSSTQNSSINVSPQENQSPYSAEISMERSDVLLPEENRPSSETLSATTSFITNEFTQNFNISIAPIVMLGEEKNNGFLQQKIVKRARTGDSSQQINNRINTSTDNAQPTLHHSNSYTNLMNNSRNLIGIRSASANLIVQATTLNHLLSVARSQSVDNLTESELVYSQNSTVAMDDSAQAGEANYPSDCTAQEPLEADPVVQLDQILRVYSPIYSFSSCLEEFPENYVANCLAQEERYHPQNNYFANYSALPLADFRPILIDWLQETAEKLHLSRECLFLAINYVDRYLALNSGRESEFSREKLQPRVEINTANNFQLLGISCLSLASKFEENKLDWRHFQQAMQHSFADFIHNESMKIMEIDVLSTLKFYLRAQTPVDWAKNCIKHLVQRVYSNFLAQNERSQHRQELIQVLAQLLSLKSYCKVQKLLDFSAMDNYIMQFHPSILATAILCVIFPDFTALIVTFAAARSKQLASLPQVIAYYTLLANNMKLSELFHVNNHGKISEIHAADEQLHWPQAKKFVQQFRKFCSEHNVRCDSQNLGYNNDYNRIMALISWVGRNQVINITKHITSPNQLDWIASASNYVDSGDQLQLTFNLIDYDLKLEENFFIDNLSEEHIRGIIIKGCYDRTTDNANDTNNTAPRNGRRFEQFIPVPNNVQNEISLNLSSQSFSVCFKKFDLNVLTRGMSAVSDVAESSFPSPGNTYQNLNNNNINNNDHANSTITNKILDCLRSPAANFRRRVSANPPQQQ